MGPIEVPADKYWGAQTQRSKENFTIGGQTQVMFPSLFSAIPYVKGGKLKAIGVAELSEQEILERAAAKWRVELRNDRATKALGMYAMDEEFMRELELRGIRFTGWIAPPESGWRCWL